MLTNSSYDNSACSCNLIVLDLYGHDKDYDLMLADWIKERHNIEGLFWEKSKKPKDTILPFYKLINF